MYSQQQKHFFQLITNTQHKREPRQRAERAKRAENTVVCIRICVYVLLLNEDEREPCRWSDCGNQPKNTMWFAHKTHIQHSMTKQCSIKSIGTYTIQHNTTAIQISYFHIASMLYNRDRSFLFFFGCCVSTLRKNNAQLDFVSKNNGLAARKSDQRRLNVCFREEIAPNSSAKTLCIRIRK